MGKYIIRRTYGFVIERVVEANNAVEAEYNFYDEVDIGYNDLCNGQWYGEPDVVKIGDEDNEQKTNI